MKKALITGATGFAGSHLSEYLISKGNYEVIGTYLNEDSLVNTESVKDKIKLRKVDLLDSLQTENLIEEIRPDMVFHLAALSATGASFLDPAKFINNNISSQVNILEPIKKIGISPKVLIVSSAEVYGDVSPENLPIDENTPLRPVNPYAVSKVAQDFMGLQYYISSKMPIVRVRPFNHIGPRQAPNFAVPAFAKKIAEIEKGKMEPTLKVGNLTAKRDFTDVKDMVRCYVDLIEKGEAGEVYNAGRGKSTRIEDILNKLLSFSEKEIRVEEDPALLRPVDIQDLVCDNTKLKDALGWEPVIDIDQTLKDTLDYWRSII